MFVCTSINAADVSILISIFSTKCTNLYEKIFLSLWLMNNIIFQKKTLKYV